MPKLVFETFKNSLSPWIENFPYQWDVLREYGQKIEVAKHCNLCRQNQKTDFIYVVQEGRIRLYLISPNGDEKAVAIIGKNGIIGETGLFTDEAYSLSAITASKAKLIKIPVDLFKQQLSLHPSLTQQVFAIMDLKLRILSFHTMQLSFYTAAQRIGYTLFQLGKTYGTKNDKHVRIQIAFTHQELANLVGTSRVTVANTMKELEEQGFLSKQEGKYIIHDPELLFNHLASDFELE